MASLLCVFVIIEWCLVKMSMSQNDESLSMTYLPSARVCKFAVNSFACIMLTIVYMDCCLASVYYRFRALLITDKQGHSIIPNCGCCLMCFFEHILTYSFVDREYITRNMCVYQGKNCSRVCTLQLTGVHCNTCLYFAVNWCPL